MCVFFEDNHSRKTKKHLVLNVTGVSVSLLFAGVRVVDTRDALGRPRFLPYPPWRFLQPETHPDLTWLIHLSKYDFHFVSMDVMVIHMFFSHCHPL